MIKRENFPNAYKEVYVILNNMETEEINKIPKTVIKKIKNEMNEKYQFQLDLNKEFKNQVLLRETKVILGYIFLNYLATSDQKRIINKNFYNNKINNEKNKGTYSENIFKKVNREKNEEKSVKKNNQIIEYKKDNLYKKIINVFKRFLKKKLNNS